MTPDEIKAAFDKLAARDRGTPILRVIMDLEAEMKRMAAIIENEEMCRAAGKDA